MSDSDPITRLNAALEGRYRIERELGEGGMATVSFEVVRIADDVREARQGVSARRKQPWRRGMATARAVTKLLRTVTVRLIQLT